MFRIVTVLLIPLLLGGLKAQEVKDENKETLNSEREHVDSLPDTDVSEAVQRRPDLEFSNVTVDGENVELELTQIATDAVSGIEVLRAITVDVDADSRGGSLNLQTVPAFKLEKRSLNASYTHGLSLTEDGTSWLANLSYGEAFESLGVRITAETHHTHDYQETYYLDWQLNDNAFSPLYIAYYTKEKIENSKKSNGSLDYQINDKLYVYFRYDLMSSDTFEKYPELWHFFYTATSGEEISGKTRLSDVVTRKVNSEQHIKSDRYNFFTGFNFNTKELEIDGVANYQQRKVHTPSIFQAEYNTTFDLEYALDEDNLTRVDWPINRLDDLDSYSLNQYFSGNQSQDYTNYMVKLNIKRPLDFSNWKGFLKAGFKFKREELDQLMNLRFYAPSTESQLTLDDVAAFTTYTGLMDVTPYRYIPSATLSESYFQQNPDDFNEIVYRSREQSDSRTFDVAETISAAYTMINLEHGKLRTIMGARIENTRLDYSANEVLVAFDYSYQETIPTDANNSYTNIFPGIHLRYYFGSRTTLLASWTNSIERPAYETIVPYRNANYNSEFLEAGNPVLKPTLHENYDLSIDYKLSEETLFSIDYFRKVISDVVYFSTTQLEEGIYEGWDYGTYQNGPDARLDGWRCTLTHKFVEGLLEDWSIRLKGTWQGSSTTYPTRPDESLPIIDTPKQEYQGTLSYNSHPLFFQLTASYRADAFKRIDSTPWKSLRYHDKNTVNAYISYQIHSKVRLFCNYNNITRTENQYDYTSTDLPARRNDKESVIYVGFRTSF